MKVRTLTAIIALLIFLPILLKGGLILMLFAFLLALIALKELLNMNMIKFLSIPGLRISVPALTEERRKELVKEVKKIGEDAKVSIRNIRRDINDQLKKDEKNGDITEDDLRSQTDDVQKATDNSIKDIDQLVADKEKDIMSV